jgi:F1F0 ATPase subunit 2
MIAIALFAIAGLALGLAHFAALRWTVARFVRGQRSAVPWYLARLAGSAAVLFVLVRLGGPLALATLVGFMVARTIAVWLARVREGA